ncbi:MAG TPA: putative sugar nucleotidyl transferase [Spirochaetota bacterium]|nr:putative sugar nucleotidyl transferase [Spirochaetota bacterium]HRR61560.1 putative sugar nucleotidyl transferase [Spirochaetota bacterium]
MKIIVFEDSRYNDFYPFTMTRPVWDLRCGLFTIWQRYCRFYSSDTFYFYTRHYLRDTAAHNYPELVINSPAAIAKSETVVFINARIIYPELSHINNNTVYYHGGIPVLAKLTNIAIPQFATTEDVQIFLQDFPHQHEYSGLCISSIWELVSKNTEIIKHDFTYVKGNQTTKYDVTTIGDSSQLIIEDGVTIEPYVVVDCTEGPVYIKKGCSIKALSRIEGPCAIDEHTTLLQAKVRAGCSIGPWCRIGGEVEESIFSGYDNKYHEGFIGHSYIGEWVNLGALTTNSDLKNNYTTVMINRGDEKIDTGLLKVGCFIGDFTMTGIGTLINTGSTMGPCCMIVQSSGLTPKFIPPFCWYIGGKLVDLPSMNRLFETCKTMMSRRNHDFVIHHQKLLEKVYEQTKVFRKGIGRWIAPK